MKTISNSAIILPIGTIETALNEIIEQECIQNARIQIKAGCKFGDNYVSDIYSIKIHGTDGEWKDRCLSLIVKVPRRLGKYRVKLPPDELFQWEVFMYQEYLPTLYQLQRECNIVSGFMNVAKVYKYSTAEFDEYLIMSDLKIEGFEMVNRQDYLDLTHCQLVLQQLACMHGLGYVYKHRNQAFLNKMLADKNENMMTQYFAEPKMQQFWILMSKRAHNFISKERDFDLYQKFGEYINGIQEKIVELDQDRDEYCTIIHGDCWHGNILFKYDTNGSIKMPIELRFLDWQMSQLHSPVKDLSYFIYNGTSADFREQHFQNLLNYYYENLARIISECGVSPDIVYSYEIFQKHINKYFCHGLHMALGTLRLVLCDTEEELKDQMSRNVRTDLKLCKSQSENKYMERIVGIIRHAVSQRFI